MIKYEGDYLGDTRFHEVRRTYCGHMKIPKQNSFSICDTCEKYNTSIAKCKTAQQREKLLRKRDYHYDEQMRVYICGLFYL